VEVLAMNLQEQSLSLIWLISIGFVCGFVFDIYRVFYRQMHFKKISLLISDLCFGVLLTFVVVDMLNLRNQGENRFYVILGLGLGGFFYLKFCRRVAYKVIYKFFRFIRRSFSVFMKIIYWFYR
jgi:spore cortex biosynthesis protein YabQ